MAYVMNGPRQRDYGPASDGYLASIADGYRDFGFEDLTPLRAAQVEAVRVVGRAAKTRACGAPHEMGNFRIAQRCVVPY